MRLTRNGYEILTAGTFDPRLGHHYINEDERRFYALLQQKGFKHVEDPQAVLRSREPCYTVNCGYFVVPMADHPPDGTHIEAEKLNQFQTWYPDAIIRSAAGKIHFVELKGPQYKPRKYRRFKRYYIDRLPLGEFSDTYLKQAIASFREKYGDNVAFHLLARARINYEPATYHGKTVQEIRGVVPGTEGKGRIDKLLKYFDEKPEETT